jgi:hypothetical protein
VLLTIILILLAMLTLAVLELWLFWELGERHDRRRQRAGSERHPAKPQALRGRPPQRRRPALG